MKHHHDASDFDPEPVIGQILAALSDVPTGAVESVMAEVQHRVSDEPEAVPDSDISVLHEWGLLSSQCHAALTRHFQKSGGSSPDRSIGLSDIARLPLMEISTMSNLGRQSRMEMLILLEDHGFQSQDSEIISLMSAHDRLVVREKMQRRIAFQSAARDRDRALLGEWTRRGANWQAVAKRLGCSAHALRGKVAAAARRVAFRDAHPVFMPGEDRRPES